MSEQPPKDDLIGKTLGQFTILEEIGRGGMATVYKATQQSVNRVVALKVLPRSLLHDPGFMERFKREVDVASHLEHPHILPIYDYGEAEGVPYIAMRYLGGGSMAQMIRRGVPAIEALEKPFTQVAQALDYAHQQRVIHRDLKPGNIMLDENGNAYLSDFGIVHVLGSNLTGSMIVGTPAYMSPEQANGLAIDGRSDIYALGIVLFELITGREPYQAETPMALLLKHINEPMPPLRDFREGVPDMVEDVISKATAKDPDERYSSATDMAKAFSEALRSGATRASRTRPAGQKPDLDHMPTTVGAPIPPTENVITPTTGQLEPTTGEMYPSTDSIQPGKSQLPMLLGILVIAVVVIVAAVLVITSMNNPGPVTPTPVSTANLVPTPFPRASTVSQPEYSITMPDVWMPQLAAFTDESDSARMMHLWQADDNSVHVSLAIPTSTDANAYASTYYDSQPGLHLIDSATAQDGTVRHSYRVENSPDLENGQIDVFYIHQNGRLAVLELYTADSVASDRTLLTSLQLILDSVRIKSSTTAS